MCCSSLPKSQLFFYSVQQKFRDCFHFDCHVSYSMQFKLKESTSSISQSGNFLCGLILSIRLTLLLIQSHLNRESLLSFALSKMSLHGFNISNHIYTIIGFRTFELNWLSEITLCQPAKFYIPRRYLRREHAALSSKERSNCVQVQWQRRSCFIGFC